VCRRSEGLRFKLHFGRLELYMLWARNGHEVEGLAGGLLACPGFGNRAEIRALSGVYRVLHIVVWERPRL
jgi:hypothetical protein